MALINFGAESGGSGGGGRADDSVFHGIDDSSAGDDVFSVFIGGGVGANDDVFSVFHGTPLSLRKRFELVADIHANLLMGEYIGLVTYFDKETEQADRISVIEAVSFKAQKDAKIVTLTEELHGRQFTKYFNIMKKRFQPLFKENCKIENLSDLLEKIADLTERIWDKAEEENDPLCEQWKKRLESLKQLKTDPKAWENFLESIRFGSLRIQFPLIYGRRRASIRR